MLTQEKLRSLLSYDEVTGIFRWINSAPGIKANSIAGCLKPSGYVSIQIEKKLYRAHRLAWLYVHGFFPVMLDHKDRCRSNNALHNLRPATNSTNIANAKVRRDSKSGIKGVRFVNGRWSARIEIDGCQKYLGVFDTKEDAGAAFALSAKARYGEFAEVV